MPFGGEKMTFLENFDSDIPSLIETMHLNVVGGFCSFRRPFVLKTTLKSAVFSGQQQFQSSSKAVPLAWQRATSCFFLTFDLRSD